MQNTDLADPTPDSAAFTRLQSRLPDLFRQIMPNPAAPRTIVVLPSLSLDNDILARVRGAHHYEERMLGMLMLLRLPRTRIIYLTSQPVADVIVDYHLHLLQGVPSAHARARLTMLACHDGSDSALTGKVLARPRLLDRIAEAIGDPSTAHMTAYMVTEWEQQLALRLGIPIYGCDPALACFGTKSGGRHLMRGCGANLPDGIEDLRDPNDLAEALLLLRARTPALKRAVVKLNDGFSGDGNALFRFDRLPEGAGVRACAALLPQLAFEASGMNWETYRAKFAAMGGIVEAFIEGHGKRSPSVQFRIDPFGLIEPVSTHDQLMGGPNAQIFLGCRFPADPAYRLEIQAQGTRIAEALRARGVLGRFGIDFISVPSDTGWTHYAIEINLRKGGTTHPFLMLQCLTGGKYECGSGRFITPAGQERFYQASDNLESSLYAGLTPPDLVDIAVLNGLHYDGTQHEGVVFHLIGALSEFGKLGVVCVGASPARAAALFQRTVDVLDRAPDAQ